MKQSEDEGERLKLNAEYKIQNIRQKTSEEGFNFIDKIEV